MAQLRASCATIEEWRRKSYVFYGQNGDSLFQAAGRGFEAMGTVIKKENDPEQVERVLSYLSLERALARKFEKSKDDPLRELVHGLLESLGVALSLWTGESSNAKENMEVWREEWGRKSSEFYSQNGDSLFNAVTRAFESLGTMISQESDSEQVERVLAYLELERTLALKFEKNKDDPLRELVHGLLESIQLTLNEWREERKIVKETGEISTEKESTEDAVKPKEEPEDGSNFNKEEQQIPPIDSLSGISMINNFTLPLPPSKMEPKEEPIDAPLSHVDQLRGLESIGDFKDEPILDEDMVIDKNDQMEPEDESDEESMDELMDESDGEGEPSVKKKAPRKRSQKEHIRDLAMQNRIKHGSVGLGKKKKKISFKRKLLPSEPSDRRTRSQK